MILWLAALPFVGAAGWPAEQWPWIVVAALMSSSGTLLFAWAYARGEASYLAVTEYSAFLWAAALGWLVFREPVSPYTLAGAALIVGGCLVAARGKSAAPPEMDVAPSPIPSTLMVKASTPMLKTNAARQWTVTTLRMCWSRDLHVGRLERHPAGEGEIDEVPITGLGVPGKSRPTQPCARSL